MPAESSPLDEFLGFGMIRPFQRDKKNDFASAGGRRLVQSTIGQILGTDAQGAVAQGEIPWRPEFGSLFYLLKHRKGPLVMELGRQYAQDALAKWEPRTVVTRVTPKFDAQGRVAEFQIRFDLIDSNRPGNQVLIEGAEANIPIV